MSQVQSTTLPKTNIAKNKRLVEIVYDHLPFAIRSSVSREVMLNNIEFFNVERMFESALANASKGKYEFVDANGHDFSDFSDAKTASLNSESSGTISGTLDHLEYKIGCIRAAMYNPIVEDFHFFFIPHHVYNVVAYERGRNVNPGQTLGANSKTKEKRLRISYAKHGKYYKYDMEKYRIATFEELALAEEKDFYNIETMLA